MRTSYSIAIYLFFISCLLGGCGGCNGGELSTREKLIGTWLINNAGQLQSYMEGKPQFRMLPIKNSKLTIKDNGTIRGFIENIEGDPQNPGSMKVELLQAWEGKWKLTPDENAIFVEGVPQERVIKNAAKGAKNVRTVQFINTMPIEFLDERTINITSENAVFQFKLVTREI